MGALLAFALFLAPTAAASIDAPPLPKAHAHNDYEHDRPLLDALDHGFCSVEADIYLIDGALLVAHDREDVTPERTLQALYLDPLKARVDANRGSVYGDGTRFWLLIDIKSDGEDTYRVLREVLRGYADMLTRFTPDSTTPGAVTVVLSGNRPTALVAAEPERLVGVDGRLSDLDSALNPHLMPLISDHWGRHFRWNGRREAPAEVRVKLERLVKTGHSYGCRVRFWATPDYPALWDLLLDCGVDFINTDLLERLENYLRNLPSPQEGQAP